MEQPPGTYKVVELTTVTDEPPEAVVNTWCARDWRLDSIRFAMQLASRRPAMGFILLVRSAANEPPAQ